MIVILIAGRNAAFIIPHNKKQTYVAKYSLFWSYDGVSAHFFQNASKIWLLGGLRVSLTNFGYVYHYDTKIDRLLDLK